MQLTEFSHSYRHVQVDLSLLFFSTQNSHPDDGDVGTIRPSVGPVLSILNRTNNAALEHLRVVFSVAWPARSVHTYQLRKKKKKPLKGINNSKYWLR